ncbi:MAG: PP2C family protein-serine/threonine phosphatase [Lachnospirales bacterium]
MLNINCIGATYKNLRGNNEDNYYIPNMYAQLTHEDEKFENQYNTNHRNIFGVFDGLGGEEHGEMASYIAARELGSFDLNFPIDSFYTKVNKSICDLRPEKSSKIIGTTAVLIDIFKDKFICSNIGDSRAYIIRNNNIIQLSKDHTSIQTMLDLGVVTEEELKNSKYKNMLSQCLGIKDDEIIISPYISKIMTLEDNDILLLCSDGLSCGVDKEDVKNIILNSPRDISVIEKLYAAAVNDGSKDNVTIMLLYINKPKNYISDLFRYLKNRI